MRKRKIKGSKSDLSSQLWKIGILVLIPLLILDGYLLWDSRLFNVKTVEISLDKVNCASRPEIKEEAQVLGQNIFSLDKNKIEKKIRGKYFCVKSVNIFKNFPDKVTIQVSGREAVAVLALLTPESTSSGILENVTSQSASISAQEKVEAEFLVDREGIVFLKGHRENLPIIYFGGADLQVGKNVGEGVIQNALKILEKMKTFGIYTKEAKIYSQDILLINPVTQTKIIFALNKNIDVQLASLQLIMTQAKINEEEMEFIDLRFDKPIVKYVPIKK